MDTVAETVSRVCQALIMRMDSEDEREAEGAREALGELMPSIEGILWTNSDGGPGSGNWGHAGRPGHRGGSAAGGGKAFRLSTPSGGYTSRSQAEKENKRRGNASGSSSVVNGKDITDTYDGDKDTRSVIHSQGFDGKPRVVGKDEFNKAVAESSFIAQRTYSAPDQGTLDKYRDQLYDGEFYVECTEGGAQYGQGMYCAADYTGKLSDGIKAEMKYYKEQYRYLGEDKTKEEWISEAKQALQAGGIKSKYASEWAEGYFDQNNEYLISLRQKWKISEEDRDAMNDVLHNVPRQKEQPSYTETLTLDPSAKVVSYDDVFDKYKGVLKREVEKEIEDRAKKEYESKVAADYGVDAEAVDKMLFPASEKEYRDAVATFGSEKAHDMYLECNRYAYQKIEEAATRASKESGRNKGYEDVGAYAAALGYDAINADGHGESGSYTVILNRTKAIFLDGRGQRDAKDAENGIVFQYGDDGVLWAIKDREVIGRIYAYDPTEREYAETTELDGGPGSGNWGHSGRPGHRGGSAPGGGRANRLTTPDGGYTSMAQAKKENAAWEKQHGEESEGSGTGKTAWKDTVDKMRAETLAKKDNHQAIDMIDCGYLDDDTALEMYNAGTISTAVNKYYDILESNGDPTPTKATVDKQKPINTIAEEEYDGDYTAARKGEIKKETGASDEESEAYLDAVRRYTSSNLLENNNAALEEYISKAPAYSGAISRGLRFAPGNDSGDYDKFMQQVRNGVIRMEGVSSWTSNEEVARRFAHNADSTWSSVVVTCVANKTSVPIEHLTSVGGEDEVLASGRASWSVLNVTETETEYGAKKAYVTVIERGEQDGE